MYKPNTPHNNGGEENTGAGFSCFVGACRRTFVRPGNLKRHVERCHPRSTRGAEHLLLDSTYEDTPRQTEVQTTHTTGEGVAAKKKKILPAPEKYSSYHQVMLLPTEQVAVEGLAAGVGMSKKNKEVQREREGGHDSVASLSPHSSTTTNSSYCSEDAFLPSHVRSGLKLQPHPPLPFPQAASRAVIQQQLPPPPPPPPTFCSATHTSSRLPGTGRRGGLEERAASKQPR